MIDEKQYEEFMLSVIDFISTSMTLWNDQKNLNISYQDGLEKLLKLILEIYNKLENYHKICKNIFLDYEKRLSRLEDIASNDGSEVYIPPLSN